MVPMSPLTFKIGSKLCRYAQRNIKTITAFRTLSTNTETLEPVEMSYATYESAAGSSQTPPLIIMHGLFGSKSNWNSLCKVYNQKTSPPRKIIAIDARNHGDSAHSQDHTYAHLAADIRALYDRLNIQKAALMGHSMGGRAMMMFALKYVGKQQFDKALSRMAAQFSRFVAYEARSKLSLIMMQGGYRNPQINLLY